MNMTVDHILPQSLSKDIIRKQRILKDYGLPETFDLEDYGNWLPCHQKENREKSDTLFPKETALYYLHIARNKSKKAVDLENKLRKEKRNDKYICNLLISLVNGDIDKVNLLTAIEDTCVSDDLTDKKSINQDSLEPVKINSHITDENHIGDIGDYIIVVSFGYPIGNVCEMTGLKRNKVLEFQGMWDDQLESKLKDYLHSITSYKFLICENIHDKDYISIRVAFVSHAHLGVLKNFDNPPWKILEFERFSNLYHKNDIPRLKFLRSECD